MHYVSRMLGVFQKFYQLKVIKQGISANDTHFSARSGCEPYLEQYLKPSSTKRQVHKSYL